LFGKKLNGKTMYTYGYVMERAGEKFCLAPDTIADIVRAYVPPSDDPDQLDMFTLPETTGQPAPQTPQQ